MKKFFVLLPALTISDSLLSGCREEQKEQLAAKPVIYLYPEAEMEVTVRLDYDGDLTCTYPVYDSGWTVTARPDGTLADARGQTYNYLYREGVSDTEYGFSRGFCVSGGDTAAFPDATLAQLQLGVTRREANAFIVYWLPRMEQNPYHLISFQSDTCTDHAVLTITPETDSVLRVFMAWKPLKNAVSIPPQDLPAFSRTGFAVAEWGGTEVH